MSNKSHPQSQFSFLPLLQDAPSHHLISDFHRCQWGTTCNQLFADPQDLFDHVNLCHIGRKSQGNLCLKCEWLDETGKPCNVQVKKRDHITSHVRVHLPLKPFVCQVCTKAFKRAQDYRKHKKGSRHKTFISPFHNFSRDSFLSNINLPRVFIGIMSLELDGSILEGGGQILRNSIALSALLRKPIKISNIRANRSQKGLKAQHLCGVQLVKRISNADVQGDALRSSFVSFSPNDIIGLHDLVDVGTAGSIALLIQISLPVLLYADKRSEVTLRGGTNATAAPQIDYVELIFLPTARRLLFSTESKSAVSLNVRRRGYYPKGGGEVQLTVEPLKEGETLSSFDLTERGDVLRIHGRIFISGNVKKTFLSRMASKVKDTLYARFSKKIVFIDEVQEDPRAATGDAWGLMLWCETSNGNVIAASGIGERGHSPETLAHKAASDLLRDFDAGGCVDEYLQDQLIIYMALAQGESSMLTGPLTLHTRTAIYFVQVLTGIKFEITEVSRSDQGQPSQYLISCTGLGLKGKAKFS